MYYLIKDGKISGSSELPLSSQGYETIQKDFSQEEIEKLNSGYLYIDGEIVEGPEVKEFEKKQIIEEFKTLEKEATEKRSQYLTAELLPEGEFKNLKLSKLASEGDDIKARYEAVMSVLIERYGESILQELI